LQLFVALVSVGCGDESNKQVALQTNPSNPSAVVDSEVAPGVSSTPITRGTQPRGSTLFENIPAENCGISFVPKWQPRDEHEALLLKTGFTGGGVCLGDYDGDGKTDLFLTRPHGGGKLYRNLGDFQFQDATDAAKVSRPDDWPTGAAFCDLNNDGKLDLIVACLDSPNRLFLNQGDGTFKDVSLSSGFDFSGASIKTIFADYDNDGDLDVYLVTNRLEPKQPTKIRYTGTAGAYDVALEHQELAMVINLPSGEQKFAKAGQFDRLLRNDLVPSGELRFTDVTKEAGIAGNFHGLDGCWWDADNDGDADLYITNDFTDPDQFFKNNGDGTFTDVTQASLPCTPWFAMGCDAGDLNNDGLLDLLAADMAGTTHYREKIAMGSMDAVAWFLDAAEPRQYMRNSLFVNTGTHRFQEAAHLAGLAKSDWTWSVKIADFDNDGREDVFFTNGFTRDYLNSDFNNQLMNSGKGEQSLTWYDAPRLDERNLAFRNQGDLRFADASSSWGVDQVGISFGAAVGDLDNDGDLDLVVNNFEAAPSIYRNGLVDQNCCKIILVGSKSNRQAIGAAVEIKTDQDRHYRYHNPSGGFLSCDESTMHFGLGEAKAIQELTVRWPSGIVQTLHNVPSNQVLTIREPNTSSTPKKVGPDTPGDPTDPRSLAARAIREPLFTETDLLGDVVHRETQFDDFAQQPLLPNKLSQLGPGMSVGDINGDSLPDLFIGGAAGELGQLLLQTSSHEFEPTTLDCLEEHRQSEDMGCLLVDVDGDEDLDLLVVSGGVESEADSPTYRDRLYLNSSTTDEVRFEHAADALPDLRDSGGPVSAVDFDNDGDLDLFIGGRVVPGQYPTPPKSRLLRNEGGSFVEVNDSVVSNVGMVTSALWSDFDNDGWTDLLITNDYGPIRILRNDHGNLVDVSDNVRTSELLGWWNSITGCDFDLDGDTDYVVGNLGTNTKYHPSVQKPQYLFYGNFEGGDKNHIVEAKSGGEGLLPTRGRSCSCNAMPFLAEKYETFHEFASASLVDIYTDDLLQQSQKVVATVAESGVLINTVTSEGTRVFEFRPLPVDAQMSPVFGVEIMHANDDRFADLFLAQNFYTPQRETGRMAGGLGCVLLGKGDGTFEAVSPNASGVVIPDDAKSTIATDLDNDGRLDIVVATNDGGLRTFTGKSSIHGQRPFLWSVGDSVMAEFDDGKAGKFERYLGSGYLSSGSSPWLQIPSEASTTLMK
ncbi:MAG: VCBS repeat-containing protein, partial [Aeoliella sp.]